MSLSPEKQLAVVIVCGSGIGFPDGGAPTARVTCYARALRAQGADVMVVCLGPSEPSLEAALNTEAHGRFFGIPFSYSCGSPVRARSFLFRRFARVRGLLVGGVMAGRGRRGAEHGAVLLYSRSLLDILCFALVVRLQGLAFVADVSEKPFFDGKGGLWRRVFKASYLRWGFRYFDGLIVISRYLEEDMRSLTAGRCKLLRIPILVDVHESTSDYVPPESPPYVCYAGLLNEHKDGVRTLMEAFSWVASEFPGVRLRLVGGCYGAEEPSDYANLAIQLGLSGRVDFTGNVSRAQVRSHLRGATVLVLARPTSLQADAGFPTKIAEYLSAGRPVVVTRTGEIGRFLRDGTNAYLVDPDDADAFAAGLRRALNNPDEARIVGQRGRMAATTDFDYLAHSARITTFLLDCASKTRSEVRDSS